MSASSISKRYKNIFSFQTRKVPAAATCVDVGLPRLAVELPAPTAYPRSLPTAYPPRNRIRRKMCQAKYPLSGEKVRAAHHPQTALGRTARATNSFLVVPEVKQTVPKVLISGMLLCFS